MTAPYRLPAFGDVRALAADASTSPEVFVRRALGLLEAEYRALALLALADWERLELVAPELFAAVGGLQRPSWGTWSFLLQSLRNARKAQLRGGRAAVREAIEHARTLSAILALFDSSSPSDLIDAARPAADFVGGKQHVKRLGDVLTLPIALRNRVAHFPPTDEAGWTEIRAALAPLIAWHGEHPNQILAETATWPEPWFANVEDTIWAFNGAEKDFAVSYASPTSSKARSAPEQAGACLRAIQRLLGKTGVQEQSFYHLLARLAPEEIRGVILGDFLVGPPVGQGGFATVHVGRQLSTDRKVAIKILHDGFSDEIRLRFQQEAAFLSRIDHEAVVGIISYGEDAWSMPRFVDLKDEAWFQPFSRGAAIKTYIALEWIDGQTLEELFCKIYLEKTSARPSLDALRSWFRQSAEALAAVHAAGLIHRDLKPSNLMLTSDDSSIRLMDFGVARSEDETRTLMTSTGHALGTPPYMSPEQLRARDADAEVGPATDVYSLCATFYELSTGTRLFDHDKESPESVMTQKLRGQAPTRPRALVKGLPWELETILVGGLAPETADRYRTAEALARDLAHWQRNEPLEYRRPGVARRAQLAYRRYRAIMNIVGIGLAIAVSTAIVALSEWRRADLRAHEAQEARAETERSRIASDRARADLLTKQAAASLIDNNVLLAATDLNQALALGETGEVVDALDSQLSVLLPRPDWTRVLHSPEDMHFDLSTTADGARVTVIEPPPSGDGSGNATHVFDGSNGSELAPAGPHDGDDGEDSLDPETFCAHLGEDGQTGVNDTGIEYSPDRSLAVIFCRKPSSNRNDGDGRGRLHLVDALTRQMIASAECCERDDFNAGYAEIWLTNNGTVIGLRQDDDSAHESRLFRWGPKLRTPQVLADYAQGAHGDVVYDERGDHIVVAESFRHRVSIFYNGKKTDLPVLDGECNLALDATGTVLANETCDGSVQIWRLADMRLVGLAHIDQEVSKIALSARGAHLFVIDTSGTVTAWSIPTVEFPVSASANSDHLTRTESGATWLARHPDSLELDDETGRSVKLPQVFDPAIKYLQLCSDGALVALGSDSDVLQWKDGASAKLALGDDVSVWSDSPLSCDNRFIYFGNQIVDRIQGRLVATLPHRVRACEVPRDDRITCLWQMKEYLDNAVMLNVYQFNKDPRMEPEVVEGDSEPTVFRSLAYGATSRVAYAAGCGKSVEIHDLETAKTIGEVALTSADCVSDLRLSDAGIGVVSFKNGGVNAWSLLSNKLVADLKTPIATDLAFTHDGNFLAVASPEGVSVWHLGSQVEVFRRALPDVQQVVFSRDENAIFIRTAHEIWRMTWRSSSHPSQWRAQIANWKQP